MLNIDNVNVMFSLMVNKIKEQNNQAVPNSYSIPSVIQAKLPFRVFQKDSLPPTRFNFFPKETYENNSGATTPIMNFNHCNVCFGSD